MRTFFCGIFKVVEHPEAVILRMDMNPRKKIGLYEMTDGTGEIHEFNLDLSGSVAKTFSELAMYALLAYLINIKANGWDGEISCLVPPMGFDVTLYQEVIEKFKFAFVMPSLGKAPPEAVLQ